MANPNNQPESQNKDYDLIYLEGRTEPKYEEALETLLALRKAGYQVLYGGRKGHGFWIQGHTNPQGKPFFTVKQSLKLIEA